MAADHPFGDEPVYDAGRNFVFTLDQLPRERWPEAMAICEHLDDHWSDIYVREFQDGEWTHSLAELRDPVAIGRWINEFVGRYLETGWTPYTLRTPEDEETE